MSSISRNYGAFMAGLVLALIPLAGLRARPFLAAENPAGAEQNDPRLIFERGQNALEQGHLEEAESAFRKVLSIDPNSAGAYANLGVVYMREKRWGLALNMLRKAERLSPQVAGIKLNIGLAYYRQNKFREAIPNFETVVRDAPGSAQARHLLGLCYFFTQNYSAAAATLAPLEPEKSSDLNYLYVLAISAWKSNQPQLEQTAMRRLVAFGGNTAEFHLLMGKAHLNREEYGQAIDELELAARSAPKLPFVHFYLGLSYLKQQEFEPAKTEFLRDAAIEPDVSYNYDQLGLIELDEQHLKKAEEYYLDALRLDPDLASSRYQLARVYQQQGEYAKALSEADLALKLEPENSSVHYLRGQLLERVGRTNEARAEMRKARDIQNQARTKRQQELESPEPDLRQPSEP